MADNTNVQAVRVVNEKIRPSADLILQTYFFMKTMQAQYVAQDWATLFPAGDPTGEIIDGARIDGRKPITNSDVNDVVTALGAFLTFMEQNTSQQLNRFLTVSVNPER